MHFRSGGTAPGRDGCGVPLPWSGTEPPFGFSPPGATTWLPQPASWARPTDEAQRTDPDSTLNLCRAALRLRCALPRPAAPTLEWLDASAWAGDRAADLVAFARDGLICVVNTGDEPTALPAHHEVLLASTPLDGDLLPGNSTVWLGA